MDATSKYQFFLIQHHAGVARDLPTISPFAREIARLPRTQTPTPPQLSRAFETDPFLAAKLTGAANSVFFARDHLAVLTVPEAIKRVGMRYALNLLREAPPLPTTLDITDLAPLWAHCMAVAHVAKSIALDSLTAPFEPDAAHLLGMIHDIGYLLQISYSPATWVDIAQQLGQEEYGSDNTPHEVQGEELARFWSLPPDVVRAIRTHHDAQRCTDPRERWLASVIELGEILLRRTSTPEAIVTGAWPAESLMLELGVPRALLPPLRAEALRIVDECIALATSPRPARPASHLKLVRTGGQNE